MRRRSRTHWSENPGMANGIDAAILTMGHRSDRPKVPNVRSIPSPNPGASSPEPPTQPALRARCPPWRVISLDVVYGLGRLDVSRWPRGDPWLSRAWSKLGPHSVHPREMAGIRDRFQVWVCALRNPYRQPSGRQSRHSARAAEWRDAALGFPNTHPTGG